MASPVRNSYPGLAVLSMCVRSIRAEQNGVELLMIIIYKFQSLPLVIGGFVWGILAVPDPPLLLYFFSVNDIMVCSEVFFSEGLCCRETGQLIYICWFLYDMDGCRKVLLNRFFF